jgi:predicted NAD/FAD-dependent oxidoreductase
MNSFAKYLSKNLDIALGHRVNDMQQERDGAWSLGFEKTAAGDIQDRSGYHGVICTAPPPQALALLPQGFSKREHLANVRMDACFALMIGLDQKIDTGWDSLRVNDLPVAWLAMNSSKPDRAASVSTLMIHSAPEWSNENVETDRDEIKNILMGITTALTDLDLSAPAYSTLHRWLYASVSQSPHIPCLMDKKLNIVACGDWCLGGRVEGAALSGQAAAQALMRQLSSA